MNLPEDVWYNIASYLPPDALLKVQNLHPLLKELADRVKYRALSLTEYTPATEQTLTALSDPSVGDLVKAVHVRSWEELPPVVQRARSWRHRLREAFRRAMGSNNPQPTSAQGSQQLSRQLRRLSNVIGPLSQVSECAVEWDEVSQFRPEFIVDFLTPTVGILGQHLVKFALKVPSAKLKGLASLSLPHLEELHVQLCTGDDAKDAVMEDLDGFIVFVNNLHRSLQVLKVSTTRNSRHLDVTSFFRRLGTFRNLVHFSFLMPVNGMHLSNRPALVKFIKRHAATLESLELGFSSLGLPTATSVTQLHALVPWAQDVLHTLVTTQEAMVNLTSLQLGTRPMSLNLLRFQESLQHLSPRLESLSLMDGSLRLWQIVALLDIIPAGHGISSLSLTIRRLSPELLETLASRLPTLGNLELRFNEIISHDSENPAYDAQPVSGKTIDELNKFVIQMQYMHSFSAWQLRRIAFTENAKETKWLDTLEKTVINLIPGITFAELLHCPLSS